LRYRRKPTLAKVNATVLRFEIQLTVNIFFTPDYSQFGDLDDIESLYRLKKARIVGLWLSLELRAVVIPFITFSTLESIHLSLTGLENCSVVAFSTKGYVKSQVERDVLRQAIRITVDTLNLTTIVVYDVCRDDSPVNDIFSYAQEKGVNVITPDNTLKTRNKNKVGRVDAR
jgi:hypothetical protein